MKRFNAFLKKIFVFMDKFMIQDISNNILSLVNYTQLYMKLGFILIGYCSYLASVTNENI